MAPRCGVIGCSSPSGQITQRKITGSPVRPGRRPCISNVGAGPRPPVRSAHVDGFLLPSRRAERGAPPCMRPWSVPSNGRPWRRSRPPNSGHGIFREDSPRRSDRWLQPRLDNLDGRTRRRVAFERAGRRLCCRVRRRADVGEAVMSDLPDHYWTAVANRLRRLVRPSDLLLAPNEFLADFRERSRSTFASRAARGRDPALCDPQGNAGSHES